MVPKWVYRFDELDVATGHCANDWDEVRGLLGGKGANLADMTRLGIPVPPGFTITSRACNAYLDTGGGLPPELSGQTSKALAWLEEETGKQLGDAVDPLLVSCRSGAKFSMPGMMDTVLNIGLNSEIVDSMITGGKDARFILDSYRRLIQMFGTVVLDVPDEPFQETLREARRKDNVTSDSELSAGVLSYVIDSFMARLEDTTGRPLPPDPQTQLSMATEAVFRSWNGRRAKDYRKASHIPDSLGTAVNIQTMVFGNSGANSATGVAVSRSATTGAPHIEGDFLMNAQGEDVVAGIRETNTIDDLSEVMPEQYEDLTRYARQLELHYSDMQDIEFTIDDGELWILQTRNGKRTAQAAVRIAVDLASEGTITRDIALERVSPEQVEFFLHPQFDADAKQLALDEGTYLTTGLNVSPGAAVGLIALDADLAESWAQDRHESVILVRPETKPDDVHGMLAAVGVLTSSGGRTSHAALVARQFGRPAVVGASEIQVDLGERRIVVGRTVINEGDRISIDGTTGEVFLGAIDTKVPDIDDVWLMKLLEWADEVRRLGVWANADHPHDAELAVKLGATGIGLCRTEHMFFGTERLPIMQEMVMAANADERRSALTRLLPLQRRDFAGLFRAMDGYEVIIRLLDPPLHEFLPNRDRLADELTDLKIRLTKAGTLDEVNTLFAKAEEVEKVLERVEALRESNPMLGLRGVRLAVLSPEMPRMQIRAIFEAVSLVHEEGIVAKPSIMVPLTSVIGELTTLEAVARDMAATIRDEKGMEIDYRFGTMIETPRAALTAAQLAETAEFFSFGTNDLTQMTFGISRDDAEHSFLLDYLASGVLEANPFNTLDREGVGGLIRNAVEAGRHVRPDLHVGICGEHGGDPASIAIVDECGLDYVSCSPLRVPVARIAAAQSALRLARSSQEPAAM
ncbi:MAG: pyruvate, phosphate dikinase [Actinomycetia bacterium]|nr:pyruvate, phosphate dikinase [Actinomycetes bacterium]